MVFSQRVLSITQDYYVPKVVDQVLQDNIFLYRQVSNGKAWRGETLKIPVMIALNTNTTSYSGMDTLAASTVETRQTMTYDPRAVAQGVTIGGLERTINSISDTQVLSLVQTELEIAQVSMADALGTMFYGDGTGNGSKDFNGADNLNDDGTTATNVGGLSRTTYTSLKGTRTASGGTVSLSKISTLLTAVTGGSSVKQSPTILISDMSTWDLGESLLQPAVRANYDANGFPMVTRNSEAPLSGAMFKGAGGFKAIIYRGVPWIADQKSTSQTLWTFNERYLDWYGARDPKKKQITFMKGDNVDGVYSDIPTGVTGFQMREWTDSYNQDAMAAYIHLYGNMTTSQPRRHGRLTGITSV